MQHRVRSFAAIELEPHVLDAVGGIQRRLADKIDGVRWSTPAQLHITLKFLGEVESRDLPDICTRMDRAVEEIDGFAARFSHLGAFPSLQSPRILWLGLDSGVDQLRQLHNRLDQAFAELGVRQEGRGFQPHVTLGRCTRQADKDQIAGVFQNFDLPSTIQFEISRVHLLASLRESGRVVYQTVHQIPLTARP
jgi:RNA 2',3'-cyclic 3'-phosphodiesterase